MSYPLVNIDELPEEEKKDCKDLLESYKEVIKAMIDFFGEEFTDYRIIPIHNDLIDYGIRFTIWYPEITITNENDKSITVKDLYVFLDAGKENPFPYIKMLRGTMTQVEINHRYIHSHSPSLKIHTIDGKSYANEEHCCLGTSPLNHTFIRLIENNKDIDVWKLLFMEIDRYAHTESLSGGPYISMSKLVGNGTSIGVSYILEQDISDKRTNMMLNTPFKDFLLEYLKEQGEYANNIKFSWEGNRYGLGMSYSDYLLDISNKFIKWRNININKYNIEELDDNISEDKFCIKDGKLYFTNKAADVSGYKDAHICWFKGKEIKLKIISSEKENNGLTLISPSLASHVLSLILCAVNIYAEDLIKVL